MGASAKEQELIGAKLNETYVINRLIEQGGMGSVYEAGHVRLTKKRFAIKLLRPEVAQDEAMYARFRREAEITSELGHPHIISVLDFLEMEDGRPYMVMEFLTGKDMGHLLSLKEKLSPEALVAILDQVGSGLQAAHDLGVVHRDI